MLLKLSGNRANVISVIPGQLVNRLESVEVCSKNNVFIPNKEFSKAAVLERHHATSKIGLGIVRGFGIESAAIASTISHDSHNVIVIGDNDNDMMIAIDTIKRNGGGIFVVSNGQVLGGLPLPVAGLMSDMAASGIISCMTGLNEMSYSCGVDRHIQPFGMLSFLALPVIPEVRITPDGLFDVFQSKFINV